MSAGAAVVGRESGKERRASSATIEPQRDAISCASVEHQGFFSTQVSPRTRWKEMKLRGICGRRFSALSSFVPFGGGDLCLRWNEVRVAARKLNGVAYLRVCLTIATTRCV